MFYTPSVAEIGPADSNAPRIPPSRLMLSVACRLALESTGHGLLDWAVLCWLWALGSGLAGRPPNRPVAKPVKGCEIHLLCLLCLLCLFICFQKAPRKPPGIWEGCLRAQEGSMRAPDGPGEAPGRRPGGRKIVVSCFFVVVCFHVFHVFCALAHAFGACCEL